MKKFNLYWAALSLSVLFLVISLFFLFSGNIAGSGPFMVIFFIFLALGIRGFQSFKGLSYTVWILTAVTASMFYPEYFTTAGDFQLKKLIVPLLQIIMFGMGSQMSLNDFTGVIKMPKILYKH